MTFPPAGCIEIKGIFSISLINTSFVGVFLFFCIHTNICGFSFTSPINAQLPLIFFQMFGWGWVFRGAIKKMDNIAFTSICISTFFIKNLIVRCG